MNPTLALIDLDVGERGLAGAICELVRERDRLAARIADLEANRADLAARMYRRGYRAGHAAGRRGAPLCDDPERSARGQLRAILSATEAGT